MELQRGVCFLCHNVKVITASETRKANRIICTVLSKNTLNVEEFNNIQSTLKLCPVCYHKLSILKCIRKNIETGSSDKSEKSCIVCKRGKTLFKVTDWLHFDNISEDLDVENNTQCIVCSDCLFYLDTRNEVKTKLFSKYPQLKVSRNGNKDKFKAKNSAEVTPQLSPISENKYRRTFKRRTSLAENKEMRTFKRRTSVEILENEENSCKKSLNLDFIKTLKPLKHNKIFKGHRIVKADSKFLKQVPYVLLEAAAIHISELPSKIASVKSVQSQNNDLKDSIHKADSSEMIKPNKKNRQLRSKSMIIKKNLNEHVIIKDLIVNLSRIKLSQKQPLKLFENDLKSYPEIEKLNDNLDISQNLSNKMKTEEKITSGDFDTLQTGEPEIKLKRKSVSFAEDKNVEIEYSSTESKNKISNRSNILGKHSFVELDPKKSKNKRDVENENLSTSENNTESECQISDQLSYKSDVCASNKELLEGTENGEEIVNEQSVDLSLDKAKKTELNKSCLEESEKQNENLVEKQNVGKSKKVSKKYKPRPLSKKIKVDRDNHLTTTFEDTNNINTCEKYVSDDNKELIDSQNIDLHADVDKIARKEENVCNESIYILKESSKSETESCETNRQENEAVNVIEQDEENLYSNKSESVGLNEDIKKKEEENPLKPKQFSKKRKRVADLNPEDNEEDENSSSSEGSEKEKLTTSYVSNKPSLLSEEKNKSAVSLDNIIETACREKDGINLAESSEVETSQFMDKYVEEKGDTDISEENDDSGNFGKSDYSANEKLKQVDQNLNGENKKIDQDVVGVIGTESSRSNDNVDLNTFSDSEKNEDIGITEGDKDNINSIVSSFILQQEQSEDKVPTEKDQSEGENHEDVENSDITCSDKRKIDDDALNTTVDKKKKKVTFCEDVT